MFNGDPTVAEQCANIYPQLSVYCSIILSANRAQVGLHRNTYRCKQEVSSVRGCVVCASNRADVSTLQLSPLVPSRHTVQLLFRCLELMKQTKMQQ